jgi:endonuclease/exonuclease/phosphatase family metal-dependent hydrolase
MRYLIGCVLCMCWGLCNVNAQQHSITVMSYNIRYDNPQDGVNAWPKRISKVGGLIQTYNPDIIGIQEALHHQLIELLRILPDYTFVGVGRDDGKESGEYSAILFKNGRFGLLRNSTSWLSETPDVPGSKSWDAALPRIVTTARLYDKESKTEFVIFNTHFDHLGIEARQHSAELISEMIGTTRAVSEIPVIVTGDFNAEPSENTYSTMLLKYLFDTRPDEVNTGTFCGFEVGAMPCKTIDYIFGSAEWISKNYRVINDNDGKHYPSDHLPVIVELEIKKN